MAQPVTKRELDETLEKVLQPYVTKEYLREQLQLVVDALIAHMNKMEDRIAAAVFPPKRQRRR